MTPKKIPTIEADGQIIPRNIWLDASYAITAALGHLEGQGWDITDQAVLSAVAAQLTERTFAAGIEAASVEAFERGQQVKRGILR